jgi:hypothetical protein
LLTAPSGTRGAPAASVACGGFGFALNGVATFDFAPASHDVPSPPRFLVLNSRPLGIVVWHRNTQSRLIGCQAWVGLDLVWIIHLRKAGVVLPRCDPFQYSFRDLRSEVLKNLQSRLIALRYRTKFDN